VRSASARPAWPRAVADRAAELIARWGTAILHDWSADFAVPVWALVAARLGVPGPAEMLSALSPYENLMIVSGTGGAGWGLGRDIMATPAGSQGSRSTPTA
jgi:hypothetical protein